MEQINTKIIRFDDGTYFNGVKGKSVRKTKFFTDAKRINNELCDRDDGYLSRCSCGYKIIEVTITLEEW